MSTDIERKASAAQKAIASLREAWKETNDELVMNLPNKFILFFPPEIESGWRLNIIVQEEGKGIIFQHQDGEHLLLEDAPTWLLSAAQKR